MIKRSRKTNIISNIVLIVIITFVVCASFIPQQIIPIYVGKRENAIYNGDRNKNNVSLMFNVYENSKVVCSIVDTLNKYSAKATFFVGGCWADDNEETLKYIVENGHEVANHGYFHKDHSTLDYEKNKQEISLTGVVIKALCDYTPTLFAPPSGSFSNTTLEVANDLGYKVIMWTKDTIDWRDKDSEKVYLRATNGVIGGDFILMHPKEHTLLALPRILEYYISIGLMVVTVSQNLSV